MASSRFILVTKGMIFFWGVKQKKLQSTSTITKASVATSLCCAWQEKMFKYLRTEEPLLPFPLN